MTDALPLPFPLAPPSADVWRDRDGGRVLVAAAPPVTDLYVDPARDTTDDTALVLTAPTLLGVPPGGDFQFSARVAVDFAATYDAGVLVVWSDDRCWAKLCFEYSPANDPMVVSVVTRGVSDDANAFTVAERAVWLRISRVDHVYAFHASTDGVLWQFVRVFTLGHDASLHFVGFEAQSPTGNGCTVEFEDIRFANQRLADLRYGT